MALSFQEEGSASFAVSSKFITVSPLLEVGVKPVTKETWQELLFPPSTIVSKSVVDVDAANELEQRRLYLSSDDGKRDFDSSRTDERSQFVKWLMMPFNF